MDNKTKDTVFSLLLLVVGGYVVVEGLRMVERASKPPFNITHFRISPGMLPTVLGGALIFFAILLLISALRGDGPAATSLVRHLRTSSMRFGKALGEIDMQSMIVSVVIMAIYTFFILGKTPFWLSSAIFLVGLMLYLRATKLWIILATSAASIVALIVLFEKFFSTTLP